MATDRGSAGGLAALSRDELVDQVLAAKGIGYNLKIALGMAAAMIIGLMVWPIGCDCKTKDKDKKKKKHRSQSLAEEAA